LSFATEKQLKIEHDFTTGQYFVYVPPYLKTFLDDFFEAFRVPLWLSSNELYAQSIVMCGSVVKLTLRELLNAKAPKKIIPPPPKPRVSSN